MRKGITRRAIIEEKTTEFRAEVQQVLEAAYADKTTPIATTKKMKQGKARKKLEALGPCPIIAYAAPVEVDEGGRHWGYFDADDGLIMMSPFPPAMLAASGQKRGEA